MNRPFVKSVNRTDPAGKARISRYQLLASCAVAITLAATAHAPKAAAQAYLDRALQGSSTVVAGSATITRSATLDTINVNSPQAIINWNPETGGPLAPGTINFLQTGTTATFNGTADYIVLNRIIPTDQTRAISINGNVNSTITIGSSLSAPGGSVWFYSPGGIVVGAGAAFNVGNLVLTAADIELGYGSDLYNTAGSKTIHFRGGDTNSQINIMPGASITQTKANSYLAVFAPVINQGGTVQVNGQVAYLAATQADVTIDLGLFAVNFIAGSTGGNSITHTNSTTGATQDPAAFNNIYLATIAKNDAISSLLVSGTLGYTPAANAGIVNGQVVLSAGYNVSNADRAVSPITTKFAGTGVGNITLGNSQFTVNTTAQASNAFVASPALGGVINFVANATLGGAKSATLTANRNERIQSGGSLLLNAFDGAVGGTATATASFELGYGATAGVINVGGGFNLDTTGLGIGAVGGTATLNVDGGQVYAGTINLFADARVGGTAGGNATAGSALLNVTDSRSYIQAMGLGLNASAVGGDNVAGAGGSATGGTAVATISAGTIALAPSLGVYALGIGGSASTGVGGNGTGGTASVAVNGATLTIGDGRIDASGIGGNSDNQAGFGKGGSAALSVLNSTTPGQGLIANDLFITANGAGGEYGYGVASASTAGPGTGGIASLTVDSGSFAVRRTTVSAGGFGGYASDGGVAGNGKGGTTSFKVTGGSVLSVESARFLAEGGSIGVYSGAPVVFAANGGRGDGGVVNVDLLGGTTTFASANSTPLFDVSADGYGGNAFSTAANPGLTAGAGTGGTIKFTVGGGTVSAPTTSIHADGFGGTVAQSFDFATVGGAGKGGSVTFDAPAGSYAGSFTITANGEGQSGGSSGNAGSGVPVGAGGAGIGGGVDFTAGGANFNTDSLQLQALGNGGNGGGVETGYGSVGGSGGAGGNSSGGKVTLAITAGSSRFSSISGTVRSAAGSGGNAEVGYGALNVVGGKGGNALGGGSVAVAINGGVTQVNQISVDAGASAGSGSFIQTGYSNFETATATAAAGGNATAGIATVTLAGQVDNLDSVSVTSNARAGSGGNGDLGSIGGNAIGGSSRLIIDGTGVRLGSVDISSASFGGAGNYAKTGSGSSGGNALGGATSFELTNGGSLTFTDTRPSFSMNSSAEGGFGGSVGEAFAGGNGGNAQGGQISIIATTASLDLTGPTRNLVATATAGSGGDGGSGDGPIPSAGGAGGNGGDALGGSIALRSTGADASFNLGDAEFGYGVAGYGGVGGLGGAGGRGTNGIDGGIGVSGTNGGDGFSGGLGGDGGRGTGGFLNIEASDSGSFSFGSQTLEASGYGGDAGVGGPGGNGGFGGAGGSGIAGALGQNGGAGASGGNGGFGGNQGNIGRAGPGIGGVVVLNALGGSLSGGDLTVKAAGNSGFASPFFGGEGGGGFGGSGGAAGAGGAPGGQIGGNPAPTTGPRGTDGQNGLNGSSSEFGSIDPNSSGGAIVFATSSNGDFTGSMNFGQVDATVEGVTNTPFGAQRNGNFGTIEFNNIGPNRIDQTIQFAGLNATAGFSSQEDSSGSIKFQLDNPLLVSGDVTLNSSGTIGIAATGGGSLQALGAVSIATGSDIAISHATPFLSDTLPAFVTLRGDSISLTSGTGINAGGSSIVGLNDIFIQSYESVALGQVKSGGELRVFGRGLTFDSLLSEGDMRIVAYADDLVGGSATATNGSFQAEAGYGSINLGTVTAGNAATLFTRGAVTLGAGKSGYNFIIDAGTTVDATRITTTGIGNLDDTANVQITAGGAVNVGHAEAFNDILVNSASFATGGNTLIAGDNINIATLGDSALGVSTANGRIDVTAGGAIAFTSIGAGSDVNLSAANGDIAGGAATAGGSMSLQSVSGSVSFSDIRAGLGITVTTPGTITGASARLDGGTLRLNGGRGITVSTVASGGRVELRAPNGAIIVDTDLSAGTRLFALGQSLRLQSKGALSAESLIATQGGIDVTTSGNLLTDITNATGDVFLTSTGGNVAVDHVGDSDNGLPTPSNLAITAFADVILGAKVTTSGRLVVQSGVLGATGQSPGVTTINGIASGATMSFGSTDIVISPNARVGTAGTTTSVAFLNRSIATTTIGGSATTTGYVLDNAELQRVFSNNLGVFRNLPPTPASTGSQTPARVMSNAAPNVIIDTLTLNGGTGGAFSGGTFAIKSDGKVQIVGAVALTNLTTGNRFEINAADAIEALPTGSVTMTGSTNVLTGTLALNSADIFAGSSAALADIAAAADLGAASTRIDRNDTTPASDNGYFAAGGIIATVDNNIYIQNTGASTMANTDFDARRGFTVGAGGFTVVQNTPGVIKIAVNGRQVVSTAQGEFFTGFDLVPRINIIGYDSASANGSVVQTRGSFDPLSTINGCRILATSCSGAGVIVPDPGTSIARDTIEHAVEQFQAEGQLLPIALVQFQDFKGFIDQPVIDEPVTGAGNDDLYSLDDSQLCDRDQKPPCK
ncbi:hypothetical protein [Sphingomonas sp.]|uniref:hypothetical protein n=1 Tax=Sphingomonas sp. TaxID=28214 RepID=UPI0025D369FB|nr:hypothetical protein [Sphingomonas sp.]